MRIRDLLWVSFVVVFLSSIPVSRFQQVPHRWDSKKVERYIETVSVVFVSMKDGAAEGAGVVIAPDGTTLTVAHLFRHGQTDFIGMAATNGNIYELDVLAIDSRYDLALVRPKAASPTFKYAKIRQDSDIELNQDILTIGHPLSYYYNVEYGVVLDLIWHFWYKGRVLKISALTRPGNSGGPVFNTRGEVIGIVSAASLNPITKKFQYGMAVSIWQIHEFFKEIEPYKKYWPKQIRKYRLADVK